MSAVAIRPGQPQTDQKNRTNLALDLTAKPVSRTSSTSQPAAPGKTTITTESQSNDPGKNGGLPLTSPTMVPSPNASPTVGGTANTLQEGATNEAEAPITQPIMTEGMKQALELNSMYEQTYIQARVDEAASENLARRWEAQQLRISLAKHLQVQTQIIEQMKVQLDSKHATITRLKLETKESEEALDKDMDEYQATGTRMVLTYSEEKQAMSNRIEHLRRKNAEVDKYSREKDALARQLAQYEATLKAEVAAVKRKLQESAIHHRLAKDALKHEIVSKVKQRKVEKLEEAMREMPFKTRQARAYIEDTTAELQVQSSALSRLTQASVRGEVHRRILSERYTIARRDAQRISGRTYLLKSLLAKLKIRACEMYQSLVAATRERDATPEWNMDMTGYNPLTNSTLSSLSDKGAVSLPSIRRTGVGEYTAAMNTLNNEELPSQHAAALSLRGLESRLNQLNEQVRSAHSDLIAAQQHASDVSESAQFALSHLNESSRVILAALADACKSLRQRRLEQRQTSMLHKYDHGITSKSCASLLRSPALTDGLAPVYVSDFHVALSGSVSPVPFPHHWDNDTIDAESIYRNVVSLCFSFLSFISSIPFQLTFTLLFCYLSPSHSLVNRYLLPLLRTPQTLMDYPPTLILKHHMLLLRLHSISLTNVVLLLLPQRMRIVLNCLMNGLPVCLPHPHTHLLLIRQPLKKTTKFFPLSFHRQTLRLL